MEGQETWSVVKFLDENSVSAVPTKWINNNQCLWPPFPPEKLSHAIRTQLINTCWPQHSVSVFRNSTYDDYNIARSKARKAEETSDLTSEDEFTSKKRRIIRPIMYNSSDDEENDPVPVSYKTPPKLKRNLGDAQNANMSQNDNTITNVNIDREKINTITNVNIDREKINVEEINQNQRWTPSRVLQFRGNDNNTGEAATPAGGESCTCCPHGAKYLKEILRQQHLTRALLNDIFQRLQEKGENNQQTGSPSVFKDFNCPIKTKEEFEAFNDHFKNEEYVADAVSEIAKFGGSTTYDFVKRALSFFMTNDLAVGYSWLGRRMKESFNNLSLAQLIIAGAEKANKATDRKCTEESISKWLRRAGDRQKHL